MLLTNSCNAGGFYDRRQALGVHQQWQRAGRGHQLPRGEGKEHFVELHDRACKLTHVVVLQSAKPLKNAAGNTALHSEAMHCDTSASWPTEAAQALSRAFPEIVTEVNRNGQTAQQTFEGGVDVEEPAVSAPVERSTSSSKPAKGKRLNKAEAAQEFQEKAAAARNGMCLTTRGH
jgi:hypothetical protein